MSEAYNRYLDHHRQLVYEGFNWIRSNAPQLLKDTNVYNIDNQIGNHDQSKVMTDEYLAYDTYFYGGNRSAKVVHNFELAFLKHLHRNPHHWQYWVLMDDGKAEHTEKVFEMPYEYVLEMICDWWSFSWVKGDPFTIFTWYDKHKDGMKLHPKTRKTVEDVLETLKQVMKEALNKQGD